MRRALIAATCALLVLSACNGGAETRDDPAQTSATLTPRPTPEPTPCALDEASTKARKTDGDPPFSAVTDVRPNDEGGCPRVVFEFAEQVPNYTVEYADGPFSECGSGEEVDTRDWDADAFLRVRLEPSASVDLMREAEETYTGPRDIAVDGQILRHMKVICDFEAVFEWIVGLDRKRPFTVVTFEEPARLVIDVSQG